MLLRFVLLSPRIRRLNVSGVTAGLAAGHSSRQYPSLLSADSAVDHPADIGHPVCLQVDNDGAEVAGLSPVDLVLVALDSLGYPRNLCMM